MPCGDGTGPWWDQGSNWLCRRRYRWFPRRYYSYLTEAITLTKDEQKKVLEEEKKLLESELKAIENKLKEMK